MKTKPGRPKAHELRGTPIYRIWSNMIQRCSNESHRSFQHYGGRGVSVCESWRDVKNFAADMGPRPAGASLDRINVRGNYEPENCRWATAKQQARNTTRNRLLTWNGKTMCAAEWAEELGVSYSRLIARLWAGMSVGDALSLPSMANIVSVVGRDVATGESRSYLSVKSVKRDGFNPTLVSHCINGRQRTHRGYAWQLARGPEDEMLLIVGKPREVETQ